MQPQPPNFELVWDGIVKMRQAKVAPVDTMGCHKLAKGHTPKAHRFQVLVSLLLSSQTRDEITAGAIHRLQDHLSDKFDCKGVLSMDKDMLQSLIYPVGFYKRKAEYLYKISDILLNKYDEDIPSHYSQLVELPGIGPKMAHLIMLVAWNQITGIGVDVHVCRIAGRLGWTTNPQSLKDPEKARTELQSFLPKSKWKLINELLVGFGQTICLPKRPKCNECSVSQWCKYYNSNQW